MTQATDKAKEALTALLMPGEDAVAAYSAAGETFGTYIGTGWLALTDLRIIVESKRLLGGNVTTTSIPYSEVASVTQVMDRGWRSNSTKALLLKTGRVLIETRGGAGYAVELRNAPEQLKFIHDFILWKITHMGGR